MSSYRNLRQTNSKDNLEIKTTTSNSSNPSTNLPNPILLFCHTISTLSNEEWQAKTIALKKLVKSIALIVNPNLSSSTQQYLDDDDAVSVISEDSRSALLLRNIETSLTSPRRLKNAASFRAATVAQGSGSHRVILPPALRHSPHHNNAKKSGTASNTAAAEGNSTTASMASEESNVSSSVSNLLSPQSLRQLAVPLRVLLADLRTLVVKAACSNIAKLTRIVGDNARLLITDLLRDILALHGQTVKVMHGYALQAMGSVLSNCKFRSGINVLIKEGKDHRSKDVREACMKYLNQILQLWPSSYLSQENVEAIGQCFVRSLADPAQTVRMEGKKGFVNTFFTYYPDTWYKIVHSPNGVLARDSRLKKSILSQSVAIASTSTSASTSIVNSSIPESDTLTIQKSSSFPASTREMPTNPFKSYVAKTPNDKQLSGSARRKAIREELKNKAACSIQAVVRGSSARKKFSTMSRMSSKQLECQKTPPRSKTVRAQSTPAAKTPFISPLPSPSVTPSHRQRRRTSNRTIKVSSRILPEKSPARSQKKIFSSTPEHNTSLSAAGEKPHETDVDLSLILDSSFDTTSFIASPSLFTPLPSKNKSAEQKRRESSIMLRQKLQNEANNYTSNNQLQSISQSILNAHRKHMSELMDALRGEMDAIATFEKQLLNDYSTDEKLTEELVLDYYENVLVYLEKRTIMMNELEKKLEDVSLT